MQLKALIRQMGLPQWGLLLTLLLGGGTASVLAGQSLFSAKTDFVLVGAGDIGDCRSSGDEATAELLDQIEGTVFTTGDNAYPVGSPEEFEACYAPSWGRHLTRTRPSPGNHDYYSLDARPYYDYFGEQAGPPDAATIAINWENGMSFPSTSNLSPPRAEAQIKWLKTDLAEHSNLCTVAYWHHPVFSSGQHGNNLRMQPIWEILHDHGVEAVLTGHEHQYERFAPLTPPGELDVDHGMRQFIVGTGGTPLRPFKQVHPHSEVRSNKAHGVLKLTLHSSSYDWEFIPAAGQTFSDRGSAPCISAQKPIANSKFLQE